MALTFKNMQDLVIDNCQDLQKFTDFTRTKVSAYINRGYFDFVKRTKCITDTIDITTVADQESYSASDAANLAYVYHVYEVRFIDNLSGSTPQEYGDKLMPYPGGHAGLPETWDTGTPRYYWLLGANTEDSFEIGTYPICSTSDYVLRVFAYMYPTSEMSSDSDEPIIGDAYRYSLVDFACWKLFKMYSHRDREFKYRYGEHKQEYLEAVSDAMTAMFTDSEDDFHVVQNVYE